MVSFALKAWAKPRLQAALPSAFSPLIVASIGRSGSTLLWDAMRQSMAAVRFPWNPKLGLKIVTDTAWDLEDTAFAGGVVYKTHDLPRSSLAGTGAKVVFVFGPASEAALSVVSCRDRFGDTWIEEHFAHLHATGEFDELPVRDVLRFEEQFKGWLALSGVPRVMIHYDALWDHEEDL